jgi:hypothetical protein
VDKELITADGTPLHLVVFVSTSGALQGQYIVGDGCVIKIESARSTLFSVLCLLLSYYVFDINYPQQYSMLLALLQTFVMEEPYSKETNQKFKFFLKKLRPLFNKTTAGRTVVSETQELD